MQQDNIFYAAKDRDAAAEQDLITLAEAAAFLGLKKSYLYKLTCTQQIPFYKYGGRLIRFDRAALSNWKNSRLQAIPTRTELEQRAAAYCANNPR